jgi:RNA polymerase sigma factor (TIGR02999 family)
MSDDSHSHVPPDVTGSRLGEIDDETYREMHRIASRLVARGPNPTLGATALFHEVWMKLRKASRLRVTSRAHFVALVVKTASQVTTDSLRRRLARKRNAGAFVELHLDNLPARQLSAETVLQVRQALAALERLDEPMVRVFEARHILGMSVAEIAAEFDMSVRSVERSLAFSRAWLGDWVERSAPRGEGA